MDPKKYDDFARANDGRIVLVKFADGTTGLYQIYSSDKSGDAEFYWVDVDPQKLPTKGVPYVFDPDYLEGLIPISDYDA